MSLRVRKLSRVALAMLLTGSILTTSLTSMTSAGVWCVLYTDLRGVQ